MGRCEQAEGDKNRGVNCATVVQEGADDLLDVLLLVLGERSGGVDGFGILDPCSISGDSVLVGLVLGFVGRLVSKSQECFFDVSGHAQVYVSVFVVPIEG